MKKHTTVHKIKHHIKTRVHARAINKSAKKLNKTYDMHREAAGDFLGLPRLKRRKNQWMHNRTLSHVALPILIIAVSASFAVGAEVATKSSPTVAASITIPPVPANSVCREYSWVTGLAPQDSRITISLNDPSFPSIAIFSGLKLNYLFADDSYQYVYNLNNLINNTLNSGGTTLRYIKACALNPGPAIPPFTSRWNMIDQQYRDFFGRHATDAEQAYWAGSGYTAQQIMDYFTSQEATQRGPLVRLYKAYYLRWPDISGYNYWVGKMKGGTSLTTVSNFFAQSTEFKNRYGSLTNSQFVTLVYNNVLQRTPDSTGYNYWLAQLDQNKITRGGMMLKFSESNEFKKKFGLSSDLVGVTLRMYRRAATDTELAQWNPDMTVAQLAYPVIFESTEYANRVVK